MKKGFETYQATQVLGMSQVDLILTVYKGTIAYLEQAAGHFRDGRLDAGKTAGGKARQCLVHLYTTLDMKKGAAVAQPLGKLYAYMIEEIDMAVAGAKSEQLEHIAGLLRTIKEGWDGLKARPAAGSAGDGASQPATADKNAGRLAVIA